MEEFILGLSVIIGFVLFVKYIFTAKKKTPLPPVQPDKPETLERYKQATEEDKKQLYIEWCRRKGLSVKSRRSEKQLEDYVYDQNLPEFRNWKIIHGLDPSKWADRSVYSDWLKYIGAYSSKFDPDHADWDGR